MAEIPGAQPARGSLVEVLRREETARVMDHDPPVLGPTDPVASALELMRRRRTSCVVVCDAGRVRGIFTERDYLMRVATEPERLARPLTELMTPDPVTVRPDQTLGETIGLVCRGGFRHLPVVEGGVIRGLITAVEIVRTIADRFPHQVYNLPPRLHQVARRVEGG